MVRAAITEVRRSSRIKNRTQKLVDLNVSDNNLTPSRDSRHDEPEEQAFSADHPALHTQEQQEDLQAVTLQEPQASNATSASDVQEKVSAEDEMVDFVKNEYLNQSFSGSYSGIKNLQREIFLKKKVYVPLTMVAKSLKQIPSYLMHLSGKRNNPRAHYDVDTIGETVQGEKQQHIFK